jgi:hypothetical protein
MFMWLHYTSQEKKRFASESNMTAFGPIEPIAYVHAWRDGIMNGTLQSARDQVSAATVAAFVGAFRAECEALLATFS